MRKARINIPKDSLAEFCRRNHVRRLSLFGSVLREDFGPDSDVDILVEFEPGTRVGLIRLFGFPSAGYHHVLGNVVLHSTPSLRDIQPAVLF
jgi:predicted nucleotidyltransferase